MIKLGDVELFVERLSREIKLFTEDGESYLHIIWIQNTSKNLAKTSFSEKIKLHSSKRGEHEIPKIRNFYFRPTTDTELFRWYFSIISAKYAYLSQEELSVTPRNTLRRSFTFDHTISRVDTDLHTVMQPTTRNSLFDFPISNDEFYPINYTTPPGQISDPMVSFPDAPTPTPHPRATINQLDNVELSLFGSKFLEKSFVSCAGESTDPDCSDLIGQENELEINVKTVPLDVEFSENFYSCPPGSNTNPFSEETQPLIHSPTNTNISYTKQGTNLFNQGLDFCPIYELSNFNQVLISPESEEKTSWINSPVVVCPLLPLLAPLCPTDTPQSFYTKSGWLEKAGEHRNDMWRVRWFTIYNTHVTYSETALSAYPKGHFNLGAETMGYSVDTLKPKNHILSPVNGFIFRVVTPGRVYHLSAETENIRNEWIGVISKVIDLV